MAREKVVKVQCDRCKRMELQPVTASKNEGPEFTATFPDGEVIKFDDLCDRCRKTVDNLKVELKEWDREIKRTIIEHGPKLREGEAAPLATAPQYSPANPHSAAAGKR